MIALKKKGRGEMEYQKFLKQKRITFKTAGKEVNPKEVNSLLFPFQCDLVVWALRKGRAAIFADTGLGKTLMQLEWGRLIGGQCLIIAPLSVAKQTVREAEKLGLTIHYTRSSDDVIDGINITNYEMIKEFEGIKFEAVVLDESSILKALDGKTRRKLTELFVDVPYKLCCTATPAPNDITEIANHSEFLGVMTRMDMMAAFFVNDDNGWRLRGHAEEPFYRWLASWSMSIKKPSDLGYDDGDFILPPLNVSPVFVEVDYIPDGQLFFTGLSGIQDRIKVRKATMDKRVAEAVRLVNDHPNDQWLIWCGLNEESTKVSQSIAGAIEVKGADKLEYKIEVLEGFQDGEHRVLVTKPKIAGFGMNFQNAHKMIFVGLSDSWEAYYQCTRRCWRFMQEHPVDVYVVLSDVEDAIWANVQRKEKQAEKMSRKLIDNLTEFEKAEIGGSIMNGYTYEEASEVGQGWKLLLGDSVERMAEVDDNNVDLSVFSPPFMDLYSYTPTERDLGNSYGEGDFFEHFGYIIDHLLRVTKPGRNCVVHTADVPALLSKDGYVGLRDFPGKVIREFEDRGWIFHGRCTIDKNPQAQAIRTHSKGLLFVQLRKDSSWSRPAVGDYILIFRKPGENQRPIMPVDNGEIDNETWIDWAHPIWRVDFTGEDLTLDGSDMAEWLIKNAWYGIRESDTLQYRQARGEEDDKHICPLQLGTIDRCIKLWSNPGEIVLSPFAGIGSEGYQSLKLGRQFIGIELKQGYFNEAVRNLERAEQEANTINLFDFAGLKVE
jgi:DNA modification methylase